MPFTLIAGTFHLVGRAPDGTASGFEPDGDSVQFKPADPALLDRLEVVGAPRKLTSIGSTQLRLEGIDAPELHFAGSHQPRPLADECRDFLTDQLAFNPVPYAPPDNTRVLPPCDRDGTPGFILSRALEANGRPVAFAFAGAPPLADGTDVVLDEELLSKSLNARLLAAGCAYPLFYDTLFSDLRDAMAASSGAARSAGLGIWARDVSTAGLAFVDQHDLEIEGFLFPKLFRRLTEFLAQHPTDLRELPGWLADKREQVFDVTRSNFTHFDNVVEVSDSKVALRRLPEELIFISAKTALPAVAPWLAV